eukprot:TRINITY_DN10709_c0_g1_i1.p3 TRINITY_DN10709_c0_g1~~TRINITY_DN10709_c0_g1_i1.p3  ORF type:complete len:107 (+),score=3.66 TRINITY_DN10709_c0_g1_i1:56-376(+)
MILSRSKPAEEHEPELQRKRSQEKKKSLPDLEDFLAKRDYTGAITLLEFCEGAKKPLEKSQEWIAYCCFHLGKYARAMKVALVISVHSIYLIGITDLRGAHQKARV